MQQFTFNPIDSFSVGKQKNKTKEALYDSQGNMVLDYGMRWDESDQVATDLFMKSMDYRYQNELMNYQNAYNSPEQQALRMREAGLNPDLQNMPNIPSASSNAQPPSIDLGISSRRNRQLQVASMFMDIIPQAFSIYSQIKGLDQNSQMRELSILQGVKNLGDDEIGRQFSLDDIQDFSAYRQPYLSHIKNRRLRNKLDDYIYSVMYNGSNRDYAKGLVYDNKKSAETNRQGFLKLLGEFGYHIDDNLFVDVLREFNDAISGARQSEAEDKKQYHDTISGANQGALANSKLSKEKKLADNDIMADLMSRANKKIDSKDWKDQAVGAIMFIGLSLIQNMSYSHTSGKNPSTTIGF